MILTDGQQTRGDLVSEAQRAATLGVRVFAIPIREGVPEEVAIRDLLLPERIEVGAPFRVRATIRSTQKRRVQIRLHQGDALNPLDGTREVDLLAGDTEVAFESIARIPGPVTYTATVEPKGPDRFAANNRYVASAFVIGRPAVLLVDPDPSRASFLARALAANDFEVDVRTPSEIPTARSDFERFDFFILSDTPSDQVSFGQIDAIERYVREVGGGFLMAGGTQSFALGGWQHSRIEQLLPVRMDPERRREQPSLALALVIDKSGSMAGTSIELAKEAAKSTAELLSSDDYLGVIAYDEEPSRVVRMQSARNRLRILADIGRLAASGGTRILPALDLAYQDLAVTRAIVKHTILLTDGVTQENPADFEALVEAMRAEGITVSIVGLGAEVNRALLQRLANVGGGRAYFTRDAQNVPRIFMRETTTVQRSSAIEEYVTPVAVSRADFLRGIDLSSAPYLRGFVATRMKPAPAQEILSTDTGEPLLSRWRHGLGWSLAFTSDVKNRWSSDWIRWNGFGPFWSQLVREHMRQRRHRTLDMRAEVIDGIAHVQVDAIDDEDRFLNGLTSTFTVDGPLGGARTSSHAGRIKEPLPLRQTAPGLYEARFPLPDFGSFLLVASHRDGHREIAVSHAHISNPYPHEYDLTDPDISVLQRAVRIGHGAIDPAIAQLFDPGQESIVAHPPLWPVFVGAAIALFLVDLLLRRVRLFDRSFKTRASRPQGS